MVAKVKIMVNKSSAVTKERFDSGLMYRDYINQIKVNRDRFEHYFGTAEISEDDASFFKETFSKGVKRVLVLGEDWCPDVFRGMPIIARIAEASGMDLRIFPRDDNSDIMSEYLKGGEFQSIPVVVFYTDEQNYVCHWIERPAKANSERAAIEAKVVEEMPGADDQAVRGRIRELTTDLFPVWQQDSIKEIRQLISDKIGI
ncbi:MAG: Thioredoxin [Chloroflexi bacterium]|jgi:thiol-disulfide isomerase/thioredoxin|nr:MAG: Thioredoxin [Chloroflexota bacterium]